MQSHWYPGMMILTLTLAPLSASRLDEPSVNLAEIREVMRDLNLPAPIRARRVLDAASLLDQAAQRAESSLDRRARWSEAVGLLNDFLTSDPQVNAQVFPAIQFQAGVYAWASGRTFLEQHDLNPGDDAAGPQALNDLDDAIRRLRAVLPPATRPSEPADPFAQNVRFRLAQAIADRARLRPEGDPLRDQAEREAQSLLDPSITTPGLKGFAAMLKAELSNRLSQFGRASIEIEEAEKCDPPPPSGWVAESKVTSLCGRQNFDEARKLAEGGKFDPSFRSLLALRVELARRRLTSPGKSREAIEADAFRQALPLRGSNRPEARKGLIELAREINQVPPDAPADWWDLLAEGHLRMGDPSRAGRLLAKGADRAEALKQPDQAANLRYKAGACLFEASKFADSDRLLTQVVDATQGPKDVRAKAGMLRALARGRAVATRAPGASRESYLEALESQVRGFPDDPATGEARWILGRVRLASGRREETIALWSGIVHGHPRWVESRVSVANLFRETVEDQRINHDASATRAKMEMARKSLRAADLEAVEGSESAEVGLSLARLELIPDAGTPSLALDICDRLLKGAASDEQHRQARLYRMVALAESARFVEAEQVARAEVKRAEPGAILPVLRVLDRAATEFESEPSRRRMALVLLIFTARLVERPDQLPTASRDEVRLRHVRALLLSGNNVAARKEILEWGGPTAVGDGEFLRDLADTYLRLDAFAMAIEVEKLRSARLEPGSIPWFEARYGLALASYRSGHAKDARQIIDATSILHSGLGGGDLKGKFERLRQRIEQD